MAEEKPASPTDDRIFPGSSRTFAEDLWILEHQILPNIYGLKYVALRRVLDVLQSPVVATALQDLRAAVERYQENDADVFYYDRKEVCDAAARYLTVLDERSH